MTVSFARLRRRRRRPAVVEVPLVSAAALAASGRETLRHTYAEGFQDGIYSTLRLLLGYPESGATPYQGEVPADLEAWARQALGRVELDRGARR